MTITVWRVVGRRVLVRFGFPNVQGRPLVARFRVAVLRGAVAAPTPRDNQPIFGDERLLCRGHGAWLRVAFCGHDLFASVTNDKGLPMFFLIAQAAIAGKKVQRGLL